MAKRLFYSLPVKFNALMEAGKEHQTTDLMTSVREHIFLILVTRFGANCFNDTYGCDVWEYDFDNVKALDDKKHDIENNLKKLLAVHEPRLSEIMVSVQVGQEVVADKDSKTRQMRKKVQIIVKGQLKDTNRAFNPPPFVLYFSPVSISSVPKS